MTTKDMSERDEYGGHIVGELPAPADNINPGIKKGTTRPKVMNLRENRLGIIEAHVSNTPAPISLDAETIEDALCDLEIMGYDITGEDKRQRMKALRRR